jgi:hypothetical protein
VANTGETSKHTSRKMGRSRGKQADRHIISTKVGMHTIYACRCSGQSSARQTGEAAQIDRHTGRKAADRETVIQTYRQAGRQRGSYTDLRAGRQTERQVHRHTGRQVDREAATQTYEQEGRQVPSHSDIQACRQQTGRQPHRHTGRQAADREPAIQTTRRQAIRQ